MPAFVEVPFGVPAGVVGVRVDVFLAGRLRGYSRSTVQRMIADARVWLRFRPAKPSMRVSQGESVVVRFPWRDDPPSGHARLEVLYEDGDILAVDKPGDILSHPTDKTVKASVTWILANQFPGFKPFLIHRLDRETSGVLLFGRSVRAARRLSGQFESREVRKEYWAVVRGAVGFARRTVDRPLGPGGHPIRVRQAVSPAGQPARTDFSAVSVGPEASLVRAVPRTGRLHQIRVHLAWLGHPVVGDKLYIGEGEAYLKAWRGAVEAGGRASPTPSGTVLAGGGAMAAEDLARLGSCRQMLHARSLEFRHPSTGGRVRVSAPVPDDFTACLEAFGLAAPP